MHQMTARTNPIVHLVNTLQSEGNLAVFLGAGSSVEGSQGDAPFPDFDTLISRVLRDEGIDVTDDRMSAFLHVLKRWEQESILSVRLTSYLYGNPGISHLQLASVTMSLFPAINMTMYLTTNFDDLMYKALSAVTKSIPEKDPRMFSLRKSAVISEITQMFQAIPLYTHRGAPVVVKLFGDLTSNSPIFDATEMPFDEYTESKLIQLLGRTTLFIGYGLHDAPILRLLIRSVSKHPIFVVAPVNPIDQSIAQISQRNFYWLPKTFSEFISDFVEAFSAKNTEFEAAFARHLRNVDPNLVISSGWAIRECAQSASLPARTRYLNRMRGGERARYGVHIPTIARPDTGPDFETFARRGARILAIIGESGSGKSTLLFQLYEHNNRSGDDIYIYYDAQSFHSSRSLAEKLALDLAVDSSDLHTVLQRIALTLSQKSARLLIVIDALNESTSLDPLIIRYEIESLVHTLPDNIKFLFSCRRVFWDARMNPSNDLPVEIYADRKLFLLSKFSSAEARSAYDAYCNTFHLKSNYHSLSVSLREHIRDPLMLRFISEVYRDSVLPQFAPAVLVFREVMDALRRRYRQTPLIDFLDCLIDQRLEAFLAGGSASDVFFYRAVRTDSNLAVLAQQQMAGRLHSEHPLTILEDEQVISPMESLSTRFKFTYERFYEYLLGLRLHYQIFSVEKTAFMVFLESTLNRFREAHYCFYQGLKNAFVMEYISSNDVERRRDIALLVRHHQQPVASFGKDVLREVIFESGENASKALALVDDGHASAVGLVLDLGFETEGVLSYAIKGLFDDSFDIRRRSTHCLMFHARNFSSLEKMNSMVLDAVKGGVMTKGASATGLIYFFAVGFSTADKTTALADARDFLVRAMTEAPDTLDIHGIARALRDAIELEGPLFFGANYGPEGLFYPWQKSKREVAQYQPAVREILGDTSAAALESNFDALLFLSSIRVEASPDGREVRLFAYQIEYRIVQWAMIRAWTKDNARIIDLLDRLVAGGQAFNIDFALGVLEHALFRISAMDRALLERSRAKMREWIESFEARFPEFYLCLSQVDPFSFNLVPLAVLARVEAQFFTTESGVLPCVSSWLSDQSVARRKMALLAANWLAQEFPAKVLTTLEATALQGELVQWYDRVLAGFELHSPRLLDEFFDKMHFPIQRRSNIRNMDIARNTADVQYQCESFFAWLFLRDQLQLRRISAIYDLIYSSPSSQEFCLRLLHLWLDDSPYPSNNA